jgi:hypothetical protein
MNGIDPDLFITNLEILEGKVELAGGVVNPKPWFTALTQNIHAEFDQEFYRKTRAELGSTAVFTPEIQEPKNGIENERKIREMAKVINRIKRNMILEQAIICLQLFLNS